MNLRNDLAAIVDRLEKIEKVLHEYAARITAKQESDRENPQFVRAEITFDDTSKGETQADANRQHSTQEKIARYAFYAFLAAVFYAGISALQLYEMRTQTMEAFHQSEVENADASYKAAQWLAQLKIAQLQVKAAQDSATAIQRQMRQDQRAWFKIEHTEKVNFSENKPLTTSLTVVNIGKTAARKMVTEAVLDIVPVKSPPTISFKIGIARTADSVGVMYPNVPATVPVNWSKVESGHKIENRILSHDDMVSLMTGKTYFVIYARTKYVDIFGVHHISKFCTFGTPSPDIVPVPAKNCSDYNGVDNN